MSAAPDRCRCGWFPQTGGAVRRVHLLMRQRDASRPLFRRPGTISPRASRPTNSKAGQPACWRSPTSMPAPLAWSRFGRSPRPPTEEGIAPLIAAAHTAANICRHPARGDARQPSNQRAVARRISAPARARAMVAHHGGSGAARTGIGRSRRQRAWAKSWRRATSMPLRVLSRPD